MARRPRRRCSRWCSRSLACPSGPVRPTRPTPWPWRSATCHWHPGWPGSRKRGRDERGETVIGSLRGVLLDRSMAGEVLVEVNGVGYRATVAPTTLAGLGELGAQVFLHVHTHVREDALV